MFYEALSNDPTTSTAAGMAFEYQADQFERMSKFRLSDRY